MFVNGKFLMIQRFKRSCYLFRRDLVNFKGPVYHNCTDVPPVINFCKIAEKCQFGINIARFRKPRMNPIHKSLYIVLDRLLFLVYMGVNSLVDNTEGDC